MVKAKSMDAVKELWSSQNGRAIQLTKRIGLTLINKGGTAEGAFFRPLIGSEECFFMHKISIKRKKEEDF